MTKREHGSLEDLATRLLLLGKIYDDEASRELLVKLLAEQLSSQASNSCCNNGALNSAAATKKSRSIKKADSKVAINKQSATLLQSTLHLTNKLSHRFVLISGSYSANRKNDDLCDYIGLKLLENDIGVVSGAGRPGLQVSQSIVEKLDAKNNYNPDKLNFYGRRKARPPKDLQSFGTIRFLEKAILNCEKKW